MLVLHFANGETREVKIKGHYPSLSEMGVSFTNVELDMPECITYDRLTRVTLELDVTSEMKQRSEELKFSKSDKNATNSGLKITQ